MARPDLGTGLQDFSLAAGDLAVADLSPAPPDLSLADQGGSASARICSPDGWCWENPLPQGNTLSGVWGTSASSVWAVGQAGTILMWNGAGWTPQPSGTTQDLNAIWGTDANNIWAVGAGGIILKWNRASSRNCWKYFPRLLGRR